MIQHHFSSFSIFFFHQSLLNSYSDHAAVPIVVVEKRAQPQPANHTAMKSVALPTLGSNLKTWHAWMANSAGMSSGWYGWMDK